MKNRTRKNSPDFGLQPPNRGNHPGNAFRRFCNGILAICNGIAKRNQNGGIANAKFGVRAEPFNGSGTAAEELAGEVARIVDEELRKAVIPVLAEIDAITALVKECASELSAVSKDFITCASGEFGGRNTPPAPRRKGGRVSCCPKAGRVNAEGSIFTRRGRTSVVVGRRKVS